MGSRIETFEFAVDPTKHLTTPDEHLKQIPTQLVRVIPASEVKQASQAAFEEWKKVVMRSSMSDIKKQEMTCDFYKNLYWPYA